MAAEFQSQFQEAMREAEMADLKKEVDELPRRRPSGITLRSARPCPQGDANGQPKTDDALADAPHPTEPAPADAAARRRPPAGAGAGDVPTTPAARRRRRPRRARTAELRGAAPVAGTGRDRRVRAEPIAEGERPA